MFCLVVPVAASLVPEVAVATWCQWLRCLHGAGGYLPGASGGGASPVAGVPGSFRACGGINAADAQMGTQRGSPARWAVSLTNQSCRVRLIDAITLIINYLGAPFGCAFTELFVG